MEKKNSAHPGSLLAHLDYEPQVLMFGTSGRRGEVVHLSQLEVYLNALAELQYLQSLPGAEGGIKRGEPFYFATDLRPSSTRFVVEANSRGEIAQAIERAISDAGMIPVNLGQVPTPALTAYALQQHQGSIMVTGSHIPFDRNGYKTNTACGELLKKDEAPINQFVEEIRTRLYQQPYQSSLFNQHGLFKTGHQALSPPTDAARQAYLRRYMDFFAGSNLAGKRILVYQHSAVGRDLLVEILERLGAEVVPTGRSETFVPIDTENIECAQLKAIQELLNQAWTDRGPCDAIVSTDGDSDRPLLLGIDPPVPGAQPAAPGRVRFFPGDLIGMVVAEFLGVDAVVVPISCNDAVDRGRLKEIVEPKTRIGSPYVIAGMQKARLKGRQMICGWEANGGFLTGTDIVRDAKILKALPTRDAVLPILCVLFAAQEQSITVGELFDRLPRRFSRAALLKKFPRPISQRIIQTFSPADAKVKEVIFQAGGVILLDEDKGALAPADSQVRSMEDIRLQLGQVFAAQIGFGIISRINYVDGVRLYFSNGDVAHFRPSGNADELRIYAVANSQSRADAITDMGIAEPEGILRSLEKIALGFPR